MLSSFIPEDYLCNLERLDNFMDAALIVVNDAMVVFDHVSTQEILPEVLLYPQLIHHTRLGDWNLSYFRTMHLKLESSSRTYIDRLDGYPSLETLPIKIWHPYPIEHRCDQAPNTARNEPVCLFSVWKLSRMRLLTLECKAAALFQL